MNSVAFGYIYISKQNSFWKCSWTQYCVLCQADRMVPKRLSACASKSLPKRALGQSGS